MLIEESVEKNNRVELFVDSLNNDVSQVLVLIGEQTQNLLEGHPQGRLQQYNQKL